MSDLHFETARNSDRIFSCGGRHLCSTVDPTREADQWVQAQAGLIGGCQSVIVLGLGCGYHVRALKRLNEFRVHVLETSEEVIHAAFKIHPLDLFPGDVLPLPDLESLFENEEIKDASRESFAVVLHEPSLALNPTLYHQTRDFLLGRHPKGVRWLFVNRGWEAPRLEELSEGLLSLKGLDPFLDRQSRGEIAPLPLLLALRELIV